MKSQIRRIAIAISLIMIPCFSCAELLFQEDFSAGTEGQIWNGYNGWSGNDNQRILQNGDSMMGRFVASPNSAGTMSRSLGESYSLDSHAYRLSFDIMGSLRRPFIVVLRGGDDRVGLQMGYSASGQYGIGGVYAPSISYGQRISYNDGGYYSVDTAPQGYSESTVYKVFLDINGTDQAIDIDGVELAAKKVRVVFNTEGIGDLATYSIIFDLPTSMTAISMLEVTKIVGSGATWAVGDFSLHSYPAAIPEMSFGGFIFATLCLAFTYRRFFENRVIRK